MYFPEEIFKYILEINTTQLLFNRKLKLFSNCGGAFFSKVFEKCCLRIQLVRWEKHSKK